MKSVSLLVALAAVAWTAPAFGQYAVYPPVTTYYAPAYAPVVNAYYAPVVVRPRHAVVGYYAPVANYYAPAPVTSYYAPSMPVVANYAPVVPVVATPIVVGRPVTVGRSMYGTVQAYVPGQPVRNTYRFITP
jgi:hypothetical protein